MDINAGENICEEKLFNELFKVHRSQQAIQHLNEGQRVAFLLNRIEGKKHKEISSASCAQHLTHRLNRYTIR